MLDLISHHFLERFGRLWIAERVTELIERMMSHAWNQWIERGIDYLAVLWRIKALCEEEKVLLHA
jgi:hypothetical protein